MRQLSAPELFELNEIVADRIGDILTQALARANRTGELDTLLELLCMGDLVGENDAAELSPQRVLVIGDSVVREPKLRSIVRRSGADPELFDFELGYSRLKHFDFGQLRRGTKYRAILAGPMPHSTPGARKSSSSIAEMRANPDIYPPVIELRDSTGLKITNNSFARGLEELRRLPA